MLKDIFYKPNLKPEKNYKSEGTFEKTKREDENDLGPVEEIKDDEIDELIEDLKKIEKAIELTPGKISDISKPSIEKIIEEASKIKRPEKEYPSNKPEEEDNILGEDNKPSRPQPPQQEEEEREDDNLAAPNLFSDEPLIEVAMQEPKTAAEMISELYNKDKLDIYKDYADHLKEVLRKYIQNMGVVAGMIGAEFVMDLAKDYKLRAEDVPPELMHLSDFIVRSQVMRDQNARLLRRLYNIDQTIFHLRSCTASYELRKRYYSEKNTQDKDFLGMSANRVLERSKNDYDKKYKENMYNLYKYLNSSVILIEEVLTASLDEAKAKARLHTQGVDITKEPEKKKKDRPATTVTTIERPSSGAVSNSSNPSSSEPLTSSNTGNKVADIALRWAKERGVGSPNPLIYSMDRRGSDMDLVKYADCSSFTRKMFLEAGKGDIGWNTALQITNKNGQFFTDRSRVEPGDLIFFGPTGSHGNNVTLPNGQKSRVSHAGIYVGNDKYVDMSYGKKTVAVQNFKSSYVTSKFIGAMRH